MTASGHLQRLERAVQLHDEGRLAEAESLYREAIAEAPGDTNALHFLGLLRLQLGHLDEALSLVEQAIAAAPGNISAIYNRGNILREAGRFEEALESYGRVLALAPGEPAALNNRGALFAELERFGEALADYEAALPRAPNDLSLLNNRGNALLALGRYEEALASYDRALAAEPRQANALFGRANALKGLGRDEAALASYDSFLLIDPGHAEAHANRAQILSRLKRREEALAAYDRAVALKPELASAHERRAAILFELRRSEEAFAAYERAFSYEPGLPYLEGARLLTKMYLCDWSNLAAERARLTAHVREGKPAANPFAFLSAGLSPADELLCARTYAAAKYPPSPEPMWRGERYGHRKIRVGYVSGEFREQATAYLAAGLFECHGRDAFEWYGISTGRDDKSPMRKRVAAAFDVFAELAGRSDREIAGTVRRAEIDILVNLNGFFGEERTGVSAYRPSPIQINYLGYPGTMGAPYMDYILADRGLLPEEHRPFYSEQVVYLPDTYQANDRRRSRKRDPRPRAAFGLPEKGLVFSSFNNAYKITPEVFDVWMRLLNEIGGSILWLLELDPAARRNLQAEAAKRGVAPERIVFAPFAKQEEHLARIGHSDLFLDTLPVNAHTTASDALWCGVPVLTCMGATFAGRVAASLLNAAGLPELIARSLAEYEGLALRLARDPALLASIRAKLARNRDSCPLFDTPRLTRHVEAAYRGIWERHERGLPPESFAVSGE